MLSILPAQAVPFAAYVMDARTGQTLYSENADTRLHPASLTKMMTLYITFQEIERGNLSLDTMITVSKNAANQPPSRLGLKAGQKIALRYLIRAAAVKSANDAAAAIGDAIAGSPAKWGERMTRTARQLGMKNSTFKNANGLDVSGHLSTAHDMSILGRHLFYDFPQYYNIFSRRTTDAGLATVSNTNRKFLDAYKGADGIKTGFTNGAGFNLTASAERNGVRIIATIFGGQSTAQRNAKMADLLDLGFDKAPRNAATQPPVAPADTEDSPALVASIDEALPEVENGAGKTLRLDMAVATSPRPVERPGKEEIAAAEEAVIAMQDDIAGALAEATAPDTLDAQAADLASADNVVALSGETAPPPKPGDQLAVAEARTEEVPAAEGLVVTASTPSQPMQLALATTRPAKRNAPIYDDTAVIAAVAEAEPEVVTRVSTSGGSHWGVNLGRFNTRSEAERLLLKIQLVESATLGESLRKVVERGGGYDANFLGLSQEQADLACRRLQARSVQCFTMGP